MKNDDTMVLIALNPYELETLKTCLACKIQAQKEVIEKLEKDGHSGISEINKSLIKHYQTTLKKLTERKKII